MNDLKEKQDILLTMLTGIHEEHHILRLIKVCSDMLTGCWKDPEMDPRSIATSAPVQVKERKTTRGTPIVVEGQEFKSVSSACKFFGIPITSAVYKEVNAGGNLEDLIPEAWFAKQKEVNRKVILRTNENGVAEVPSDRKFS